jgi:hypothetical protein
MVEVEVRVSPHERKCIGPLLLAPLRNRIPPYK